MTHILFQVIECTLTNSQNLNVTHNNRGAIMSVSIVSLQSLISGKRSKEKYHFFMYENMHKLRMWLRKIDMVI